MEASAPAEYATLRGALLLAAALLVAACAHQPAPPADAPGRTALPYAGLALGDGGEGGALVADVFAGPAALAGVAPGDRILSVGDEPVGRERFLMLLQASRPGQTLRLGISREGQPVRVDLVVGDLELWSGPSRHPARVAPATFPVRATPEWIDAIEARIEGSASELVPSKMRLDRMLRDVAAEPTGYNRLPLNRQVLADPGALVALDRRLAKDLHAADPAGALVPAFCEVLALPCPSTEAPTQSPSLAAFAAATARVNALVRETLPADRGQMSADLRALLQVTATRRTLLDRPNAFAAIRALRYSLASDPAKRLEAFDLALRNTTLLPHEAGTARRKAPAALAALVQGEILDFAEVDGGYVVMGGAGANTYRMDRLYAVIDIGGDDRYVWTDTLPPESQTIVDLGGDDRYEAVVGGPGAGWLGIGVLVDLAGNDSYASTLGGCGAGAYGFGLLFDASGSDAYRCDAWSAGAGIDGGGALIDAGDGADAYVSQSLSQGVGGPAGIGLLVDGGGNDLYRANGPVPSSYDTPAVYMSFSQGVGFGIRPYDHGGFGALFDFGGNDRYEAGEFAQGGGYFYGVGLLHDAAGSDLYYGNRYAQGFGCHQAAGLLTDLGGDDTYWAMTAAAQGAAWDQSAGMLYDAAGNDVYRAESLAQGAAAEQSRAWLYDEQGDDNYSATAGSQGAAMDNSYHFIASDPVFSLGILVDAAGGDRYSSGLADGGLRIRFDPGAGKGEGNAGLAIDE